MEALKEVLYCSFAYVFYSVSRIQSAADVEQLLGRVLRMLYAERRKADALNRAYAFLSEPSFGAAARSLVDQLVAIGFEEHEPLDHIYPSPHSFPADEHMFAHRPKHTATFNPTGQTPHEPIP